jgi:hypothetical protein
MSCTNLVSCFTETQLAVLRHSGTGNAINSHQQAEDLLAELL